MSKFVEIFVRTFVKRKRNERKMQKLDEICNGLYCMYTGVINLNFYQQSSHSFYSEIQWSLSPVSLGAFLMTERKVFRRYQKG